MMAESSILNTRILLMAIIAAVSFTPGSTCFAQEPTALPGSEYRSTVRFGENDVTVPSRFGTHILISVEINGSPMEVALDTGTNYSLIGSPTANKLRLKRVNGNYVGCPLPEYSQVKIKIGKIVIQNQRLCPRLQYGMEAKVNESPVIVPAILGYDFLRNFVVELDYVHSSVVLHNPATFKHRPDVGYVGEMPFRLVNGRPHIDLTVVFRDESRRKIDALLDTGSWLPVMLTGPTLRVVNERVINHWEFGREWTLGWLGLQDYESNKSNLAGPIDFEAILGNPALARYRMIFDYPHNRLILSDSYFR
jgi:predicted aspartyl protease